MKNKTTIILIVFLSFFIATVSVGFFFLNKRIVDLETKAQKTGQVKRVEKDTEVQVEDLSREDDGNEVVSYGCGSECKKEIAKLVSEAIATLSGETRTVVKEVSTNTSSKQTTYIPMGTTFSTKSMDWVDVPDSSVYVDLINDYGSDTWVSWEVSLKVSQGNGKAFARLYDDTNKIAVNFSELSTESNAFFKQVISGSLPFWRGRNLYKVQIRSLNSSDVTYSGGRIKINY
jgi:mannose-6-phosphate isomerase-like protein (cupin superfamily)